MTLQDILISIAIPLTIANIPPIRRAIRIATRRDGYSSFYGDGGGHNLWEPVNFVDLVFQGGEDQEPEGPLEG